MTAVAQDQGVVYLIHMDQRLGSDHPRGGAQHYLGTTINLPRRLAQHADGTGARIMAAAAARGIPWSVVRTWPGGRDVERRLKARHGANRMCPRCS